MNKRNKINWILQLWDITNTKKIKVPSYIKIILKVERKYNIRYNVIATGKNQRRKMPVWHYIEVLDNYSWNKTLAICLRSTYKVKTVKHLEDFIAKKNHHWYCKQLT